MNAFFKQLWANVQNAYCVARDYLADKVAKVNYYGDRLSAQADAEDNFTKRLQGLLCKTAAFLLGFTIAFTIGFVIGVISSLLFGPILGLIGVPLAYLAGNDFGAAIARAMISYKVALLLEVRVNTFTQEIIADAVPA
jgi:hypothetical protein